MGIVKGAATALAVCLLLSAVTAALLYARIAGAHPHHPIFFYLLPVAVVAFLYGTLPATACALSAMLFAAFFLYDPVYSFEVTSPLELGEMAWFVLLALTGIKCTVELFRPQARAKSF
jgi:K+-sensing histidine kinase KdpD